MRHPPSSTLFPYTTLFRSTGYSHVVKRLRPAKPGMPRATASRASWQASSASPEYGRMRAHRRRTSGRSEEHTSELQSRRDLVCRLLLEKKNKNMVAN